MRSGIGSKSSTLRQPSMKVIKLSQRAVTITSFSVSTWTTRGSADERTAIAIVKHNYVVAC